MAVLPFDTVGQDPATSALGLGLTETLTAKLVQASDADAIQVVSPRDLRDQGVKTAEDARREFGTDLVLESSLQRSGQTIRINCVPGEFEDASADRGPEHHSGCK